MKVLSLWCGPRNVSTALMYSFAQRPDTQVLDEPFYGHFLDKTPDALHPGREDILRTMELDLTKITKSIFEQSSELLLIKNMAHHLIFEAPEFMDNVTHAFLIRDPQEMLTSLIQNIPNVSMRDTGLQHQLNLFHQLKYLGKSAPILDSKEIRLNPKKTLQEFCHQLDIPFDDAMLSWSAGARAEDGCWSKQWYRSVHKSTGFAPYSKKEETVPEELHELLQECTEIYNELYSHAIKA